MRTVSGNRQCPCSPNHANAISLWSWICIRNVLLVSADDYYCNDFFWLKRKLPTDDDGMLCGPVLCQSLLSLCCSHSCMLVLWDWIACHYFQTSPPFNIIISSSQPYNYFRLAHVSELPSRTSSYLESCLRGAALLPSCRSRAVWRRYQKFVEYSIPSPPPPPIRALPVWEFCYGR